MYTFTGWILFPVCQQQTPEICPQWKPSSSLRAYHIQVCEPLHKRDPFLGFLVQIAAEGEESAEKRKKEVIFAPKFPPDRFANFSQFGSILKLHFRYFFNGITLVEYKCRCFQSQRVFVNVARSQVGSFKFVRIIFSCNNISQIFIHIFDTLHI